MTGTAWAPRASHLQRPRWMPGVRSAKSQGFPGSPRPGPKGGVFPGKMGHRAPPGTGEGPAGAGRAGQESLPLGFSSSADGPSTPVDQSVVTRLRSLSATRGGHADPPAPSPTRGRAPPSWWVGVEARWGGRAAAHECQVRCLPGTQPGTLGVDWERGCSPLST